MRRILMLLLLVTVTLPVHGQDATPPTLPLLSEVHPAPDGGREFVELWNPADVAFDLEGWRIEDAVGNGHTFEARVLAPGARVVLWSGGEPDALGPATTSATVWNNGGDTVHFLDPSGALAWSFTYGADVPAPAKGNSLHRDDTTWTEGPPSPGSGPGQQVGTATVTVEDVPPEVRFETVPDHLRPHEAGAVTLAVRDPNGDADLAAWTLTHGTTILATGNTAGRHEVVVAFESPGDVSLVLHAEDHAGQTADAVATLVVADAALVVVLPDGGIHFPPLPPGGGPIDATPFLLRNDGTTSATPRIDVSDLQGPTTVPVAGHVHVGTRSDPAADWTWTPYDAPLASLPDLAAGSTVEVVLRLLDVPDPLPAGDYHTSFTVVA